MRPILLLTRPEPQARHFARQAHAVCPAHEVLIAPLSEIVALDFDPAVFDGARGLVLTSANAVPMLTGLALRGLPAWCVGPATARAAARAGFAPTGGGGDAAALIETLRQARPEGPLVHPHGLHLARDLGAVLRPQGFDLRDVAVYETRARDWPGEILTTLAASAPGSAVVAPLFSPRAAQLFAQQLGDMRPDVLHLVTISAACAARLPDDLRRRTTIARTPDADGMLRATVSALSHPASNALRPE